LKFSLGKIFPKKDRAPSIEPCSEKTICNLIEKNIEDGT
jgi:hypothetical protein